MEVKARIQFNTTRAIKEEPKTLTIGLKRLNHEPQNTPEFKYMNYTALFFFFSQTLMKE